VQRVVLEPRLGFLARRHVVLASHHARCVAVEVPHGDAAREHPAIRAVAVLDPVLVLEVLIRAGEVGVERLGERGPVVGVDAAQPLAARLADLVLGVAQHRLPAHAEEHAVGLDVPIPDAVVGTPQRERVTLLGHGKPLQRELMHQRVADRVLEPVGAEARDGQEVGDPGLRRADVGLVVGGVREQDHGDVRRREDELLGGRHPVRRRLRELAIDEHDMVAGERVERLARRRGERHLDTCRGDLLQHRLDRRVMGGVGRHREHAEWIGQGA
jgi:hypothetical protein